MMGLLKNFMILIFFLINGECYSWNGESWFRGVSYAGEPIILALKSFTPKHKNDPPPGFKSYK
jgi:hypothetical protein